MKGSSPLARIRPSIWRSPTRASFKCRMTRRLCVIACKVHVALGRFCSRRHFLSRRVFYRKRSGVCQPASSEAACSCKKVGQFNSQRLSGETTCRFSGDDARHPNCGFHVQIQYFGKLDFDEPGRDIFSESKVSSTSRMLTTHLWLPRSCRS